jgi:hypothetical protein
MEGVTLGWCKMCCGVVPPIVLGLPMLEMKDEGWCTGGTERGFRGGCSGSYTKISSPLPWGFARLPHRRPPAPTVVSVSPPLPFEIPSGVLYAATIEYN